MLIIFIIDNWEEKNSAKKAKKEKNSAKRQTQQKDRMQSSFKRAFGIYLELSFTQNN